MKQVQDFLKALFSSIIGTKPKYEFVTLNIERLKD